MRFLSSLLFLSLSALALSGSVASASAVEVSVSVHVPESRPVSDKFLSTFEPLIGNQELSNTQLNEAEVDDALGGASSAPWLQRARGDIGQQEIRGATHNPKIVAYWSDAKIGMPVQDDETPWNGAFVGAMLERSGVQSSRSGAAVSYRRWGKRLAGPAVGSVVVIGRGKGRNHVGFVVGKSESGNLMVLGGNQGDMVKIAEFRKVPNMSFHWPTGSAAPAAGWNTLPVVGPSQQ